jgi:hypothetical protein
MTNDERIDRAYRVLDVAAQRYDNHDKETLIIDLMTDLLHVAENQGMDPDTLLTTIQTHYNEEA